MRIHYLQHVSFEGPGRIRDWAAVNGHQLTGSMLYNGDPLPAVDEFDLLVVMGGPMGAYDEARYPYLKSEKTLIGDTMRKGTGVLGICLGAQLIAAVSGAAVRKNRYREIGWHTVRKTSGAAGSRIFESLPASFTAFHWHGDTFDIPAGAIHCVSSDACENQAFTIGTNVLALQFHLESTRQSVELLLEHGVAEIDGSEFVQDVTRIKGGDADYLMIADPFEQIMNKLMMALKL